MLRIRVKDGRTPFEQTKGPVSIGGSKCSDHGTNSSEESRNDPSSILSELGSPQLLFP